MFFRQQIKFEIKYLNYNNIILQFNMYSIFNNNKI